METLATKIMQRDMNETLLERGLRRDMFKDEYILMHNGKWVRMEKLIKFQLFDHAIQKVKIYVGWAHNGPFGREVNVLTA